MKTYLLIASLVGILAAGSPPAMAVGPGRNDHDTVSEALFLQPNQPGIVKVDDGYYMSRSPWQSILEPFLFPGSGRYNDDYYRDPYGSYYDPYRGYPYGNNQNYYDPYRGDPFGNNQYYYKPKRLTERQVVNAVRNQRFHHIAKVWFDNSDRAYKVQAVDNYGRRVLLLVDPYSGRIVRWSFRR